MSLFRRSPDGSAEEIVDGIAQWAEAVSADPDFTKRERFLVQSILFEAAVICYRAQTEHMGSREAADYVKNKIDRKVRSWADVRASVA